MNSHSPAEAEILDIPDAELRLWRSIDSAQANKRLLHELIDSTAWRQDRISLFGKRYLQPRLSAWYGDKGYCYSGIRLEPTAWTETLYRLKRRVELLTGKTFNSLLLNYYRDHNDSMGMHSDDEPELGPKPSIASLSLGEARVLVLKHKQRKDLKPFRLRLDCGSLLLMGGSTQACWRHGINKQRRVCGARINLTFRHIISP